MAVRQVFSVFKSPSVSNNPPVTILHGLFGSRMNWRSLAGKLARETERLVSYSGSWKLYGWTKTKYTRVYKGIQLLLEDPGAVLIMHAALPGDNFDP